MRGDVAVVGWGAPTDGAAHLIRGTLVRRLAALALRLSVWLVPALLFGVVMAVTVYALTGFGIPLGVALVPFTLVIVHFTVTRFAYAVAARRRRAPTGVDLTREKHPDLWATIDAVYAASGARPPARVLIGGDPVVVAAVGKAPRARDTPRRVLVLGVAPMCTLTTGQWRAALLQALAVDVVARRGDRRLVRGQLWMDTKGASAGRFRLLGRIVGVVVRAHAALAAPVCQSVQLEADRRSAALTCVRDAGVALDRVAATTEAWEAFWSTHVIPGLVMMRRPMNLLLGFREYLEVVGLPNVVPENRSGEGVCSTPHPMRAEALGQLVEEDSLEAAATSAAFTELVSGPPAISMLNSSPVIDTLEVHQFEGLGFTPLPWEELAELTASNRVHSRAAWFADTILEQRGGGHVGQALAELADPDGVAVWSVP